KNETCQQGFSKQNPVVSGSLAGTSQDGLVQPWLVSPAAFECASEQGSTWRRREGSSVTTDNRFLGDVLFRSPPGAAGRPLRCRLRRYTDLSRGLRDRSKPPVLPRRATVLHLSLGLMRSMASKSTSGAAPAAVGD